MEKAQFQKTAFEKQSQNLPDEEDVKDCNEKSETPSKLRLSI